MGYCSSVNLKGVLRRDSDSRFVSSLGLAFSESIHLLIANLIEIL